MQNEVILSRPGSGAQRRFLGVDAAVGVTYLDRLVDEGYLDALDSPEPSKRAERRRYALSERGLAEGKAEFITSFADLTRRPTASAARSAGADLRPRTPRPAPRSAPSMRMGTGPTRGDG